MKMKIYAAVAAVAGFFAINVCLCAQDRSLVILHVNDTHSHIDPVRSGEKKGLGGTIERAAYIDSVRKAEGKNNVLLLHAGDFDQGSSYFNLLGGELEVQLMNDLGYDATTLGNHEFDNGIEDLAGRLSKLKAHVVCANYDFSLTAIGPYVKPYVVLERAGLKVAIIGLLTDVRRVVDSNIASKLQYLDPAQCVNTLSPKLRQECDLVIVLSHLGFEEDCELATKTHDVDLIVGGHSHTTLEDKVICSNADGKAVTVVQDGEWGVRVGELRYRF